MDGFEQGQENWAINRKDRDTDTVTCFFRL